MSDQQIFQFVFNAGFSTAEKVTNVSGRGVGMDVVRTNIQKIGGSIELSSVAGHGSTFVIKIPLTLAIVSALIVAGAGLRFALPQICVLELVGVDGGGAHQVETIRETPLLRLRDRLLPLVVPARPAADRHGAAAGRTRGTPEYFVVVTQVGSRRLGIIVDEVFDTEEIVVKPVTPMLREIPFFSGNTILGDGGVVMILDPNGIAASVGEGQVSADDRPSRKRARRPPLQPDGLPCRRPLAQGGADGAGRATGEHRRRAVERAGGRDVIQYRGHMMPLISRQPGVRAARQRSAAGAGLCRARAHRRPDRRRDPRHRRRRHEGRVPGHRRGRHRQRRHRRQGNRARRRRAIPHRGLSRLVRHRRGGFAGSRSASAEEAPAAGRRQRLLHAPAGAQARRSPATR